MCAKKGNLYLILNRNSDYLFHVMFLKVCSFKYMLRHVYFKLIDCMITSVEKLLICVDIVNIPHIYEILLTKLCNIVLFCWLLSFIIKATSHPPFSHLALLIQFCVLLFSSFVGRVKN